MLNNLPIRYKLLLNYCIVMAISLPLGSFLIYAIVQNNIRANIESELKNTTEAILSMVKTSAEVSIKNHLRAVAEKNREIVQYFYDKYRAGEMSESEAQKTAAGLLLTQTIGTSGYIYCIDSFGTLKVHPAKEYDNANMAGFDNVRYQMEKKEGLSRIPMEKSQRTRTPAQSPLYDLVRTLGLDHFGFLLSKRVQGPDQCG